MERTLHNVFEGLSLAQYLGAFQAQGFDSWDTVLDITEADLEALGVKLGHRRKLQRRIAHSRGVPTNHALPAPTQCDARESSNLDSEQTQTARESGSGETAVTKRRYRRHPKLDKNAPERPPSAYVLFSNKTREELKGQSLSFTDIAKIVGENWQSISKEKRETFERQAQPAKDKYRCELAKYKGTPEHESYARYLQDFKMKQQTRKEERGPISASVKTREEQIQPAESPVSPRTIPGVSTFDARNIPSVAQSGPHRHQKLPSLSDVLDSRSDGGATSSSPQRSGWGLSSLSGRSAMHHEKAGPGGSPVSASFGYAMSGSETDILTLQPHISSNEAHSGYRTAPVMQSQPLLTYGGFR